MNPIISQLEALLRTDELQSSYSWNAAIDKAIEVVRANMSSSNIRPSGDNSLGDGRKAAQTHCSEPSDSENLHPARLGDACNIDSPATIDLSRLDSLLKEIQITTGRIAKDANLICKLVPDIKQILTEGER